MSFDYEPKLAFDPDNALMIVADSWQLLRRVDVERLLESYPENWEVLAATVESKRPDLAAAVHSAIFDLGYVVPWPSATDY